MPHNFFPFALNHDSCWSHVRPLTIVLAFYDTPKNGMFSRSSHKMQNHQIQLTYRAFMFLFLSSTTAQSQENQR